MNRKFSFSTFIAFSVLVLFTALPLYAQENNAQGKAAPTVSGSAAPDGQDAPTAPAPTTPEEFKADQENTGPEYKAYVFLAYGLTCFLLFLFFTWAVIQSGKLGKRIDYLEERFAQSSASQADISDSGKHEGS